ncbi:MAG: polysaccharide biosynthesis C-terminal domain-containing protein, partial [Dictyoglomus sp.]
SMNMIMVRGFYALHDTKTPTFNSIIALLSNIVLNAILIKPLAHRGLALATSLSSLISCILLMRSLNNKIHVIFSKEWWRSILKIALGGFLIGILALFSFNFLSQFLPKTQIGLALSLLFSIGIAVVVYILLGLKWNVEEAKRIFNIIRRNLEIIVSLIK